MYVPIWMLISLALCLQPPPIPWEFLYFPFFWELMTQVHMIFFFFLTFHIRLSSSSGKLCPNPAAYHSVSPYHTKPGKAHPRRIGGSDEIKYTRRLIWITGARSMRTVERFLSLTERRWCAGFEREGKKPKSERMTKRRRKCSWHRGGSADLFIIHQ